ncbi:MAG TPA: DUF262 domain-containing protein [Hyphomonadaceae bacterium]|nr:DUF262 domain-containing protein [Hyphomonadaceae bacterium]
MKRADVLSIRSLFSGSARFRVAPTHRGFVWTPQEVAQLVVDMEIAARDPEADDDEIAERFYLGVLNVRAQKGGVFIVQDGVQRLTTIALMLAFIRDRVRNVRLSRRIDTLLKRRAFARPAEPRLRLSPESHAWFSHFILPAGATMRLPAEAPIGSPRELLLAARFMEQCFAGYGDQNLVDLAEFAMKHTAVVRTLIDVSAPATPARPTPPRFQDEPLSHYGVAAE